MKNMAYNLKVEGLCKNYASMGG